MKCTIHRADMNVPFGRHQVCHQVCRSPFVDGDKFYHMINLHFQHSYTDSTSRYPVLPRRPYL